VRWFVQSCALDLLGLVWGISFRFSINKIAAAGTNMKSVELSMPGDFGLVTASVCWLGDVECWLNWSKEELFTNYFFHYYYYWAYCYCQRYIPVKRASEAGAIFACAKPTRHCIDLRFHLFIGYYACVRACVCVRVWHIVDVLLSLAVYEIMWRGGAISAGGVCGRWRPASFGNGMQTRAKARNPTV
jgi:hypothetical protein